MNQFIEDLFKKSLMDTPWDTPLIFDDVDDILNIWESAFTKILHKYCHWRQKRVKRPNQGPWMTKGIISQLRTNKNDQSTYNNLQQLTTRAVTSGGMNTSKISLRKLINGYIS